MKNCNFHVTDIVKRQTRKEGKCFLFSFLACGKEKSKKFIHILSQLSNDAADEALKKLKTWSFQRKIFYIKAWTKSFLLFSFFKLFQKALSAFIESLILSLWKFFQTFCDFSHVFPLCFSIFILKSARGWKASEPPVRASFPLTRWMQFLLQTNESSLCFQATFYRLPSLFHQHDFSYFFAVLCWMTNLFNGLKMSTLIKWEWHN